MKKNMKSLLIEELKKDFATIQEMQNRQLFSIADSNKILANYQRMIDKVRDLETSRNNQTKRAEKYKEELDNLKEKCKNFKGFGHMG